MTSARALRRSTIPSPVVDARAEAVRRNPLPFVGRDAVLQSLVDGLVRAGRGVGSVVLLSGEGGIGKTRLLQTLVDEATRRDAMVASGSAYALERDCPYAVFADALAPLVRRLDPGALTLYTRGAEAELRRILPTLAPPRDPRSSIDGAGDGGSKTQLFWHVAQFLGRLAAKRPLLLVLENVQWADPSSLELAHFVARQIADSRILLVLSWNDAGGGRENQAALRSIERSLQGLRLASRIELAPLSEQEVGELLMRTFGASATDVSALVARLYARTLGNPLFLEEILKAMVERGVLREVDGRWMGWQSDVLDLPASVREVVRSRLESLSPGARRVAEVVSVIGTRARYDLVSRLVDVSPAELADALEELCGARVLVESRDDRAMEEGAGREWSGYAFGHPIVQGTVYDELGSARRHALHGAIADALEARYGDAAAVHASEIAPHLARSAIPGDDGRTLRYLFAAGRDALARYATNEAIEQLQKALDLVDRARNDDPVRSLAPEILDNLARARQNAGDYDAGRALWLRARALASDSGDTIAIAQIERRLGLAALSTGRPEESIGHFEAAERAASSGNRADIEIRSRVARATALVAIGSSADGRATLLETLPLAERTADPTLLARVHRELAVLHVLTGPANPARHHEERSLFYARASGDRALEWSAHWASMFVAGCTGNQEGVAAHQREAERLAAELRSPLLAARTVEIGIEYASAVGNWAEGLTLAEPAIRTARLVAPRSLLPRLLVWTGLMLLERDEIPRANLQFDEAWELAGAGSPTRGARDVHVLIPAHMGMAAYHVALRDFDKAIDYGERGLAIADRLGYVAWSLDRLLPIVIEASLWLRDFTRAEAYAERLRHGATLLDHRLGHALADAADALMLRLRDHDPRAADRLLAAAAALEAIPFVFFAARMRRNAAQLIADDGDHETAIRELRRAHDVFVRLGAKRELRGTRDELRALGARPPQQTVVTGGALSGRELEIARLVASRKSNKEIAQVLGISARTVSTHLSNVFQKLGVTTRGELTDVVRSDPSMRV